VLRIDLNQRFHIKSVFSNKLDSGYFIQSLYSRRIFIRQIYHGLIFAKDRSRERPDLDSAGFGIAGRLQVLGKRLGMRVEQALAPLDMPRWAFDVLATLRRHGPPYRMTPTELTRATMLTSGAMTNRIDRLEARGLVRREADPDDRRGVRVVLTDEGRELADRGIAARFADATDVAAKLSVTERSKLESLLHKLLLELERDAVSR
jgi:DNA-binding MarR family transcriptional regulator